MLARVCAWMDRARAAPNEDSSTERQWLNAIQRVRVEECEPAFTTLSLPSTGGGEYHTVPIISGQAVLQMFCERVPSFQALIKAALRRQPGSISQPWHLILYNDGITPGNPMAPDNHRKCTAFYFSFLEFGIQLYFEDAWLPLAVFSKPLVDRVRGGLSCCLRHLLRDLFCGPQSFDEAGVVIAIPGWDARLLFARLSNNLADVDAHQFCLNLKGPSGLKPCVLCKNVMMKGSGLARHGGYLLELNSPDLTPCDLASDQDFWDANDELARAKPLLGPGKFKELEKRLGLNYNPDGIGLDRSLRSHFRPNSTLTYDPMHCFYQGTVAQELLMFLKAAKKKCSIEYQHVRMFFQADWKASNYRKIPHEMFSDRREENIDDKLKATASEVMSALPLFMHFVEVVVAPKFGEILRSELASLRSLHDVTSLLRRAKNLGSVTEEELTAAQRQHHIDFVQAYNEDALLPKHHYEKHIGGQLARDGGFLLDCFSQERKNKAIKRTAEQILYTGAFERSVILRLVQQQLHSLKSNPLAFQDQLLGPQEESVEVARYLGVAHARVAERASIGTKTVRANDVIIVDDGDGALEVLACICVGGDILLLARRCRAVGRRGTGAIWRRMQIIIIFDPKEGFTQPLYWSYEPNGSDILSIS